jgi:hypothetical protein
MQRLRRAFVVLALFAGFVSASHAEDMKNLLEQAKAGGWTLTKTTITGGGDPSLAYMWIEKVEGRKVHIQNQILADEKTGMMDPMPMVVDLDAKPEPNTPKAETKKVGDEEITIKGKKIKCAKWESTADYGQGKTVTVMWVSEEIPIYGMAKTVSKDKDGNVTCTSEVVDYGTSGAAAKPVKKDE